MTTIISIELVQFGNDCHTEKLKNIILKNDGSWFEITVNDVTIAEIGLDEKKELYIKSMKVK